MPFLHVETIVTSTINADFGNFDPAFRRIVTIHTPTETIQSSDMGYGQPKTEMLPATEAMVRYFVPYFQRFIAPTDFNLPNSHKRPETDYNCHDAVDVIEGGKPGGWRQAVERAKKLYAVAEETDEPLPLGARGALVDTCRRAVVHSFLGLGKDQNECFGVASIGGPAIVTSYADMLKNFASGWRDIRLCAIRSGRINRVGARLRNAVTIF